MRTIHDLVANENLAKLISAKRYLDKAANFFDEVFDEEGAPCDVEPIQEGFFDSLSDCEKKLERLIGTVVYHDLFHHNVIYSEKKTEVTEYSTVKSSEQ